MLCDAVRSIEWTDSAHVPLSRRLRRPPGDHFSVPITRLAVMEGRTLAIGAFRTKLDDNFNIMADSEEEAQKVREGMQKVEERITKDMNPVLAAARRDIDEIIHPSEIRTYLEAAVTMSYQAIGYRRVKNPRIWSLHDIKVLTD